MRILYCDLAAANSAPRPIPVVFNRSQTQGASGGTDVNNTIIKVGKASLKCAENQLVETRKIDANTIYFSTGIGGGRNEELMFSDADITPDAVGNSTVDGLEGNVLTSALEILQGKSSLGEVSVSGIMSKKYTSTAKAMIEKLSGQETIKINNETYDRQDLSNPSRIKKLAIAILSEQVKTMSADAMKFEDHCLRTKFVKNGNTWEPVIIPPVEIDREPAPTKEVRLSGNYASNHDSHSSNGLPLPDKYQRALTVALNEGKVTITPTADNKYLDIRFPLENGEVFVATYNPNNIKGTDLGIVDNRSGGQYTNSSIERSIAQGIGRRELALALRGNGKVVSGTYTLTTTLDKNKEINSNIPLENAVALVFHDGLVLRTNIYSGGTTGLKVSLTDTQRKEILQLALNSTIAGTERSNVHEFIQKAIDRSDWHSASAMLMDLSGLGAHQSVSEVILYTKTPIGVAKSRPGFIAWPTEQAQQRILYDLFDTRETRVNSLRYTFPVSSDVIEATNNSIAFPGSLEVYSGLKNIGGTPQLDADINKIQARLETLKQTYAADTNTLNFIKTLESQIQALRARYID